MSCLFLSVFSSLIRRRLGESPDITKQPMPWRAQQLKFRQHEVYTTFSTFSRFLRNEPTLELETIDDAPYHKESWMPSQGLSKVRCDDDVILAGHSFGGCTIVSCLSPYSYFLTYLLLQLSVLSSEPLNGFPPIPVNRTIVLDPWLEPLPTPGPVPFSMSSSPEISESEAAVKEHAISSSDSSTQIGSAPPRMLVINSEQFTVWKDHYARLKEVVVGWEPKGGRLVTLGMEIFIVVFILTIEILRASWFAASSLLRFPCPPICWPEEKLFLHGQNCPNLIIFSRQQIGRNHQGVTCY